VFYKTSDPHPYCRLECEANTMCGEVQVPEYHLDVSFPIDQVVFLGVYITFSSKNSEMN